MSIAPVNFYADFSLVPVFEWEPVESTRDAAADSQPVAIEGGDVDPAPAPMQDGDTPASTEMRLVFKGYEWRFTPGIATFPRPDWMDGITAGCTEEADPSRQDEERRKQSAEAARHRKAALQLNHQPDVSGGEAAGTASTDTSDSE